MEQYSHSFLANAHEALQDKKDVARRDMMGRFLPLVRDMAAGYRNEELEGGPRVQVESAEVPPVLAELARGLR